MAGYRSARWAGAAATLGLACAAFLLVRPLVTSLCAAAVVAAVLEPWYARLLRVFPRRPTATAAGLVVLACTTGLLPLALASWYLARECLHAYPLAHAWVDGICGPSESVPSWIAEGARSYLQVLDLKSLLTDNLQELASWAGRIVRSTARNAVGLAGDAAAFAAASFLFLRDGGELMALIRGILPLSAESSCAVIDRVRSLVLATVETVLATALLQGALAAAGFALFRVPFPMLLGSLCILFSPVPFVGPTLVWLPVAVRTAVEGEPGRALAMAVWFSLTVGTIDNVIRPFLMGTRSRLPASLILLGILGGLRAFGPAGALLGPVIVATIAAVLEDETQEHAR